MGENQAQGERKKVNIDSQIDKALTAARREEMDGKGESFFLLSGFLLVFIKSLQPTVKKQRENLKVFLTLGSLRFSHITLDKRLQLKLKRDSFALYAFVCRLEANKSIKTFFSPFFYFILTDIPNREQFTIQRLRCVLLI